jgi:hypothetical protein
MDGLMQEEDGWMDGWMGNGKWTENRHSLRKDSTTAHKEQIKSMNVMDGWRRELEHTWTYRDFAL